MAQAMDHHAAQKGEAARAVSDERHLSVLIEFSPDTDAGASRTYRRPASTIDPSVMGRVIRPLDATPVGAATRRPGDKTIDNITR